MRVLVLLVFVAASASAQTIYTWEDRDGVHFTDDYNLVPVEVRSKSSASRDKAEPAPRPSPRAAVAVAPAKPAPAVVADARLDEAAWRQRFIDAHRRITSLSDSIAALNGALPPRTECVPQPVAPAVATAPGGVGSPGAGGVVVVPAAPGATGGAVVVNVAPPVRCGINAEHDRLKAQIAQEEVRLADAQRDLEQLDRAASLAAVPREWRRGW